MKRTEASDRSRGLRRRDFLARAGVGTAGAVVLGSPALARLGREPQALDLSGASLASIALPPPPIITRAEWGADEALRTTSRSFAPLTKAVVHHTVTTNSDDDPAERVRVVYAFHTRSNGWSDIGYNFLIDAEGRIYEGRWARDYPGGSAHDGEDEAGRGVIGAHAASHNTGSVGVALLGTYTSGTTTISDAAMASLARVVAWKLGGRQIDPFGASPFERGDGARVVFPNISGHRDIVKTTCPGDGLFRRLPELRNRVAELTGASGLVGYRVLGADGALAGLGLAGDQGDLPRAGYRGVAVRAAAGQAGGLGTWVAAADGGVFAFGDAPFLGSMGGTRLNRPIVGMSGTNSGRGYWLVATDGGIFSFGDARFFGSTGNIVLNQPIVGMAPTPTGAGYWMVASDGGVFSYGDARFFGSTGNIRLAQPVVGMATTPPGGGYWMVARDGGIFSFGDARFLGSAVGLPGFVGPAHGMVASPTGGGYAIVDDNGTIHTFGDAPQASGGLRGPSRPAVAVVPVVRRPAEPT